MRKRLFAIFIIMIFALTFAPSSLAAPTGTVTIVLVVEKAPPETDVPLVGMGVSAYLVSGAVAHSGEAFSFVPEGGFSGFDSGATIEISNAGEHVYEAERLEEYAAGLAPAASGIVDPSGKVVFSGLEEGLYLFVHTPGTSPSGAPDEYSNYTMTPILVPLPGFGDGSWDITAAPKKGPLPEEPPPEKEKKPASVVIDGDKTVTGLAGAAIPEREFTFTAVQVDRLGAISYTGGGSPLSGSRTIKGAGAFAIGIGGLTVEGSPYYFLVSEDQKGDGEDGWSYSKNHYWVRVSVTDNGEGALSAAVTARVNSEGAADAIAFDNAYGVMISCEVDKDTIRRTSAAYVSLPGQEGFNNVGKIDEMFRYDINFRNTSNVDVDEFVVDDPLENVRLNQVRVEVLWTPIVWGDADGSFNLWYKTNMTDDGTVYSSATANSAVKDPTYPNTGFRLWAQGLSATSRVRLDVSDLGLAGGEYVTALRFEYGAVLVGFTSMNYARTSINGEHRSESHGPIYLQANDADILQATAPPRPWVVANSIFGDVVDWTPGAARHDYAEGAAGASGLQPISYMVSAAKPMYNEDIINSAIARTARGDLRDWDQDAVVTRLITTFEGGAEEFELVPGTVESVFIDNAERAGWNVREGGRLEEIEFDEQNIPLGFLEIVEPEVPTAPAKGGEKGGIPQTGDTSMLALWIFIMAASAAGMTLLLVMRKRIRD